MYRSNADPNRELPSWIATKWENLLLYHNAVVNEANKTILAHGC